MNSTHIKNGIFVIIFVGLFAGLVFLVSYFREKSNQAFHKEQAAIFQSINYSSDSVYSADAIYTKVRELCRQFQVEACQYHDAKAQDNSDLQVTIKCKLKVLAACRQRIMKEHSNFFHDKSFESTRWFWYDEGGISINGPFDRMGYDICAGVYISK